MKEFNFYCPTRVIFGPGEITSIGKEVKKFGSNVIMVTVPWEEEQRATFQNAKQILEDAGLKVSVFDKVISNPTVSVVLEGTELAKAEGCDVVFGIGGGSSMDTAKGIAVALTHEGSIWDYMFFQPKQPTQKTLPIICATTTSGSGSHITRYAVITNSEINIKSAIANDNIFPKVGIVDPELVLSLPKRFTRSCGFDVFTHAFESYINVSASPMTDSLALESIRLIVEYLPKAIENGSDREAREKMAWADTLAGICISNSGTTLPHAMGQAISGHFPNVPHGESLAVIYPIFMAFTFFKSEEKFATVGKILYPKLGSYSVKDAAKGSVEAFNEFLHKIGLRLSLDGMGIKEEDLESLAKDAIDFPDVQANPRIATQEEIISLYKRSFS